MPPLQTALAEREDASARTRIIEAAERLFAEHGYHAVSLRNVMALAQVNVAAAHYHFGSKKNLLQAVLDRRAVQINRARKERLLRVMEERNGKAASVEKILEAYVGPALEVCAHPGGDLFVRVSALAGVDPSPDVQDIMQSTYDETAKLFVAAIKRACPKLKEAELYWRLNCVYGTMLYLRANNGRVARIMGRKASPLDAKTVQEALRHVVPALAAGLTLPSRSG